MSNNELHMAAHFAERAAMPPPPDALLADPAARLAAQLAETEREMARRDFALDDDEHSIPIPVGDVKGVLAEVARLTAELRDARAHAWEMSVELADERARLDWLEAGGDYYGSSGNWSAWENGDAGVPIHDGPTLRGVIDAARLAEKEGTSP